MSATIQGELRGRGLRLALLVAKWNPEITERLLAGARSSCAAAGVADRDGTVVDGPGSVETPQAALAGAGPGGVPAPRGLARGLGEFQRGPLIGRHF